MKFVGNFGITLTLVAAGVIFTGCGKKATVALQLANTTALMMQTQDVGLQSATPNPESYVEPASLKMKFIAAYLSEDIDPVTQNNTGDTQMFWLNSECNENISDCNADALTTFFDFTNPAEANTALNSQGRAISLGTYKYVRLEFCKYGATGNVKVTGNHTDASEVTVTYGGCGETSAEMVPPLELKADETVKILLSYDLTDGINVQDGDSVGTSTNCALDTNPATDKTVCIGSINFNPSVVR